MARPWVDAAAAWTEATPGFGSSDVAAGVSACRAGLGAFAPLTGAAVTGLACRLGAAAAGPGGLAAVVATAGRATAYPAVGNGAGRALAGGSAASARLGGAAGAVAAPVRTQASLSACALAGLVRDGLAGTGLREVVRLFSPLATRLCLASPVRAAVSLSSLVETEQT
ncbi:MAG: hypothetical protein ACP59X_20470 [Solidesulfovibrio sp. DCME]|uniref:hypothetical protein n=1 Tax=Solidesulfovibrio sp. DCME TaxID=3447380 RepID=UPI003D0DE2A9